MTILTLQKAIQTVLGRTGLNKLEKREKRIVLVGGVFLICFTLFHLAVSPLLTSRQQTQKSADPKEKRYHPDPATPGRVSEFTGPGARHPEQVAKKKPLVYSLFIYCKSKPQRPRSNNGSTP